MNLMDASQDTLHPEYNSPGDGLFLWLIFRRERSAARCYYRADARGTGGESTEVHRHSARIAVTSPIVHCERCILHSRYFTNAPQCVPAPLMSARTLKNCRLTDQSLVALPRIDL